MKQYYIYILEEDEEISAELIDHLSNNNNIWIKQSIIFSPQIIVKLNLNMILQQF